MLRPYRLERELDRAVAQWLAWLPRWEPSTARRRNEICTVCPRYVDELALDEIPHGPLHALVTSVDALLIEHFLRHAAARFPNLERGGLWRVWVERGVVRVTSSDGFDVNELIDPEDLEIGSLDVLGLSEPITVAHAAAARIELLRLYVSLFHDSVSRLRRQHSQMTRALSAYVEPKVQKMADDLILEITKAGAA